MAVNVPINFFANVDDAAKQFSKLEKAVEGVAAAFAVKKIIDGLTYFAREAAEAEHATNAMKNALKLAGDFSEKAAQSFEDFANEIQNTTTYSDDLILSQIAVAKQFGATNDEAKDLIRAAIDLAARTGKDLPTAVQLLGKTLDGTAGAIKEIVPEVRKLTSEQLNSGEAIKIVSRLFKGAAEGELNTFNGVVKAIGNQVNNFAEELGNLIIKNKFVRSSLSGILEFLVKLQTDQGLQTFILGLGGAVAAVGSLIAIVTGAVAAMKIFGAAALAFGTTLSAIIAPLGLAVAGVAALGAAMGVAISESNKAANITEKYSDKLADARSQMLRLQKLQKLNPENEGLKKQIKELSPVLIELELAAAKASKSTEDLNKKQKGSKRVNQEIVSQYESIKNSLKNFALTQEGVLKNTYDSQVKIIKDAMAQGIVSTSDGNKTLITLAQKYQKDLGEIQKKETEQEAAELEKRQKKREEDRKKREEELKSFLSDPLKGIFGGGEPFAQISEGLQNAITRGIGGVTAILQGGAGAKKLLGSVAEQLGRAFLGIPGMGALFEMLAQGPEQVRAMVAEFANAIPDIIIAVLEAIPVVIDTLAENLDEIIIKLVDKLIERGPDIALAITKAVSINLPLGVAKAATAFIVKINEAVVGFAAKIVSGAIEFVPKILQGAADFVSRIGQGAVDFVGNILAGAGQFIQKLLDGISNAGSNLLSPGGKGGQSIIPGVNIIPDSVPVIGGLFAEGGLVPEGFPNDTFPARLTSGEQVIDRTDNERLSRFLDQQERGAEKNLTVNLIIGEEQLAKVMLNLNRRGFRTA